MFAPAATPEAIIRQLNLAIVTVLNQPEIRERLSNAGMEAVGSTPAQFAAAIRADTERLRKVINEAGIRVHCVLARVVIRGKNSNNYLIINNNF